MAGGRDALLCATGFKLDQLRLVSNYTCAQLEQTGWGPASVPNSDGDNGVSF